MPSRINHMAVWVAAFVFFGWGYLWYGLLFGNQWMAALGRTPTVAPPTTYLWSFILGLILAYATGMALSRHPEDLSLSQGISFALFMGIALYATQTLNHLIYESGSMTLWIINTAYTVIGFAIIGAIVGEFLGAQKGLGLVIANAQNNFNPNGVFAAMVIIAILALTAEGLIGLLERRLLSWRPRSQSEAAAAT